MKNHVRHVKFHGDRDNLAPMGKPGLPGSAWSICIKAPISYESLGHLIRAFLCRGPGDW